MKMQMDEKYDQIAKFLAGELSESEQSTLMDWVMSDAQNQKFFEEMVAVWNGLTSEVDVSKTSFESAEKSWKGLDLSHKSQRSTKRLYRVITIAAACLVLLFGLLTQFLFTPNQKNHLVQEFARSSDESLVEIVLDDSSLVSLNEDSKLLFENEKQRRVATLVGEAFFEVATDSLKPFEVQTSKGIIRVLGTSFNVDASTEDALSVAVFEGSVQFTSNKDEEVSIVLEKDETLHYSLDSGAIQVEKRSIQNQLSWKTGRLVFDDLPLNLVILDMENYFGVDIEFDNSLLGACKFTGSFQRPSLDEISETLDFVMGVRLVQKDSIWHISGQGCTNE